MRPSSDAGKPALDSTHCRCHCRSCGGHFSSLEAFDAHRSGGACTFLDDSGLVELRGVCKIADPTAPTIGVVVYGHERAGRAREAFGGANGRQTAPAKLREAA